MNATPRRRQSPAVYRRRRLAVLLVLLVVVAAVVVLIWQPWRTGAATPDATAPVTTPDTGDSPPPATDAAATDTPTTDPSTPAEPTSTEPQACTAAQVSVSAATDKDQYAAGENPQLTLTLTNTSAGPCTLDVGTALQVFSISSGSDVYWRSTDCQANPTNQAATIEAGQSVSSQTPVIWDRTRSDPATCDDPNREVAPAGGASYHLSVSIGGIASTETRQFLLY
ncbi:MULTISPECIES: hypothetical protein [Microbacterium]|uniref:hypothetical protein n=1 Tax=Microbacterium TaxID=33882 RepID=UPI001E49182F|nr:hypothetical protein [Microbacterium nymphoidis]MCD2497896.1 hypothetical protein [Microbacterium nymphoidis]